MDTNVYIREAADTLPDDVAALLDRALLYHCSVCLSEIATGIANSDPARPGWSTLRDHYDGLFATIPDHRILYPDADVWIDAGLIAGTLARTQTFQPHQRAAVLNDALIYLTAAREGLPVLTSDRDFDLIQQLAPEGAAILY